MEKFYQRLKRLRTQSGLSVKQTAQLVGVSVSTYRDWEYGRAIKGEPYLQIAKAFDISVGELMTGKIFSPLKVQDRLNQIEFEFNQLKLELESFFEGDLPVKY